VEEIMRHFTLKEANNLLPQIKLLVEEIKEKRQELYSVIEKFEEEVEGRKDQLEIMYQKTEIDRLNKEISELIDIIESFGAVVKGIDPLLVDFPSQHKGQLIWLCWKEGEEKIEYWHGFSEGFTGRKPVSMLEEEEDLTQNNFSF